MLLSNHNFVAFHCIMDINYCLITDSRTPILGRVFLCAKKCFDSTFFQKCHVCISSELTNNEYNSPCLCCNTFTGKEKDSETGFYYFGARYYDPSLSGLFLSVDPMSDKYPNLSPYAYCAWNPVKLVDPDGKEWDKPEDKEKAQKMENAVKNRISDILKVVQSKRKQIDRITNNEKMKASKKDKKLSTLKNELSDLEYQKELLEDFIVGLHDLGDDQDKRYSFNPSEGDVQVNTFQEVNGVIPINYQEHIAIGMANMIHETTHAIQHYRNQMKNGNLMFCEINAYSTQYAFSSDSFKYIYNNLCPSPRISEEWVRGVYYPKDGKQVHPYINIK